MNDMKRVALYARVSTDGQETDNQVTPLREYAATRGLRIVEEYVDHGVSGTKERRPELDRLMADARRRKFDGVLVWKFDRFARSTRHIVTALDEFRALGIHFISLTEAIDTSTPMGRMVFTVLSAMAELERALIVERVKSGLDRARKQGKQLGRPHVLGSRGHVGDKIHIAKLHREGLSVRKIAASVGLSVGTVHREIKCMKTQA